MTDEDGRIEEWMYDFAWKLRDETYDGIKTLENKAMSIINFSSILIPIITGILFFISGKEQFSADMNCLLVGSIVFLLITIWFAFLTIWTENVKMIKLDEHFNGCDDLDIIDIKGRTSKTLAKWQTQLISVNKKKVCFLKMSSFTFVASLILLMLSAIL